MSIFGVLRLVWKVGMILRGSRHVYEHDKQKKNRVCSGTHDRSETSDLAG